MTLDNIHMIYHQVEGHEAISSKVVYRGSGFEVRIQLSTGTNSEVEPSG
jgi:hypothetical protein